MLQEVRINGYWRRTYSHYTAMNLNSSPNRKMEVGMLDRPLLEPLEIFRIYVKLWGVCKVLGILV